MHCLPGEAPGGLENAVREPPEPPVTQLCMDTGEVGIKLDPTGYVPLRTQHCPQTSM